MTKHIEGLVAAPFTAMNPDCSINLEVVEKQANFLYDNGVQGVFICGTTGESMSLNTEERKDIAQRWVETSPAGLKVIIHVGHTSIEDCKTLGAHAQKIGAWGIGAMGPSFFIPANVEDLVSFCAEVAGSAPDLPFYYYHMPSITHINFPMISFLEHASDKILNLAGIKYTYEDLMDYQLCLNYDDGRYDILFGRDEILVCAMTLGARGAVGSTYNFAAPLYNKLIKAFDSGDIQQARELQKQSIDMIQVLIKSPGSFNAVGKAIMTMLGIDCGPVRSPLSNITQLQYQNLKAELEKIGFFENCSIDKATDGTQGKTKYAISEIKTKGKTKPTTESALSKK